MYELYMWTLWWKTGWGNMGSALVGMQEGRNGREGFKRGNKRRRRKRRGAREGTPSELTFQLLVRIP